MIPRFDRAVCDYSTLRCVHAPRLRFLAARLRAELCKLSTRRIKALSTTRGSCPANNLAIQRPCSSLRLLVGRRRSWSRCHSSASPGRSSSEVLNVKRTSVLRSALARGQERRQRSPRFSLSSKAMTSGGRHNSMHLQDYRDSARGAAANMFDLRGPLGKSEWPNGGRQEAHGSHPRKEGVEGIARETHATGATAYTVD